MKKKGLFKKKVNKIVKNKLLESSTEASKINNENSKKQFLKKNKKKLFTIKNKFIVCLIITIIIILLIIIFILLSLFKKSIIQNINDSNKPFLPINEAEYLVKDYHKTKYDTSKFRYHFHELYENRTIFKINYSFLPYKNIKKSLSYEENAKIIYESTGMLNMTLLDYYYGNEVLDRSKLNHIHICMGFDKNFLLLSTISIASLLKNSSPDTFIYLHILLLYCDIEDIQRIYKLKYINKNVEFIFYNAKQAEYDFARGKNEGRGIGDYTRVLAPEIVNNTNRILILDSGDLFVIKDLSELYFFDIGDNYFAFVLDDNAGTINYRGIIFARSKFYPNTGVCLVNVRKFREDNLYREAFFAAFAYTDMPCPYQDIFLIISHFKFKYWPLNYNCHQYYENEEQLKEKKTDTYWIKFYLKLQKDSPLKYSVDEIVDAASNPVINHLYLSKPYHNAANKEFMNMFRYYANMTGFIEEIKAKYPKAFENK